MKSHPKPERAVHRELAYAKQVFGTSYLTKELALWKAKRFTQRAGY